MSVTRREGRGKEVRYNESYEVKQKAVRPKGTSVRRARLPWIATLGRKETEMVTAKSTIFRIAKLLFSLKLSGSSRERRNMKTPDKCSVMGTNVFPRGIDRWSEDSFDNSCFSITFPSLPPTLGCGVCVQLLLKSR